MRDCSADPQLWHAWLQADGSFCQMTRGCTCIGTSTQQYSWLKVTHFARQHTLLHWETNCQSISSRSHVRAQVSVKSKKSQNSLGKLLKLWINGFPCICESFNSQKKHIIFTNNKVTSIAKTNCRFQKCTQSEFYEFAADTMKETKSTKNKPQNWNKSRSKNGVGEGPHLEPFWPI